MRNLPDDNLSIPALIELEKNSGSGFYLRNGDIYYLVTAKHVIFEKKEESIDFTLISSSAKITSYPRNLEIKNPIIFNLDLDRLFRNGNIKMHQSADVAIIKIGTSTVIEGSIARTIINESGVISHFPTEYSAEDRSLVGMPKEQFKKYEEVLISNDVFIFGYPNSLGDQRENNQIDYSRPLLRKGIIAGKNNKNKTIILDCPVYFGNSGGLAVEIEDGKIRGVGVICEYVPFTEIMQSMQYGTINTSIENSGYSIITPFDFINELLNS
jgi:hypothetical protein